MYIERIFILWSCVTIWCLSGSVKITDPKRPDTTVQEKGSLTIECQSNSSGILSWLKDGQNISTSVRVSAVLTSRGTPQTSVLTIRNANLTDTGLYTCQLDSNVAHTASIRVIVVRLDVIITAPPQFRIEKQEGEQIVFQCEAKKDTKASWFFNGLAVFSDAHNHILQTVLTPGMGSKKVIILSVRHLTYRNSGSYECRGEHPQNRDRRLLSVTTPVSDVEIVEPKVQRLTILAGDEINMKCVGDAKTRLVWYHRTKQLQSSPRPMVIVTEARDFHSNKWTSMITVRTRDSRQAGVYQCRSRNDPLNHDNVTVIIQTPARRNVEVVEPTGSSFSVSAGSRTVLKCRSSDIVHTAWYKDDQPVRDSMFKLKQEVQRNVKILMLSFTAEYGLSGVYSCRDTNNSLDRDNIEVFVLDLETTALPGRTSGDIAITKLNIHLKMYSDNILECMYQGSDHRVTSQWTKHDVVLKTGIKFTITEQDLTIRDARYGDVGIYKCSFKLDSASTNVISACIFNVTTIPCEKLSEPLNGSIYQCSENPVYGDTCMFRCKTGMQLRGSKSRTCLLSMHARTPITYWDGQQPTCHDKYGERTEGKMNLVVMRVGDDVQLFCNRPGSWLRHGQVIGNSHKYQIEKTSLTITRAGRQDVGVYHCNIMAASGGVTSGIKRFNLTTLLCPRPPAPPHGSLDGCPQIPVYGEKCNYHCDAGYLLMNGSRSTTCDIIKDKSRIRKLRWTGIRPTCKHQADSMVVSRRSNTAINKKSTSFTFISLLIHLLYLTVISTIR